MQIFFIGTEGGCGGSIGEQGSPRLLSSRKIASAILWSRFPPLHPTGKTHRQTHSLFSLKLFTKQPFSFKINDKYNLRSIR
jgi:hypothetical protein